MNTRTKYGLGAAALVAVASFQVISMMSDDEPAPKDPTPTSQPSVTVSPQIPTETETGPDGEPVPGATMDKALIETVVTAYGEFSFDDPTPYAWMERYTPLCTEEHALALPGDYPFTKVDEVDWETSVVTPKAQGRVVNVRAEALDNDGDASRAAYKVTYDTQIRYGRPDLRGFSHDGGAPTPAKPGQWVDAGTSQYLLLFVQEDGLWKVARQERYTAPTESQEHDHD